MTVKGGTTPACAACKYQRRRCTPTCPLAPYFPANQPKMFQSVHRLFGVSNVTKTLKSLQTKDQKEDAMKSIIFEAEMREKHPVHGCYGVTLQLHHHLNFALEELRCVYAQLAACREQMNKEMDNWDSSNLKFGTCSSADPNQFFVNESSNGFNGEYLDNNMARPLLGGRPVF
ncbi:hypothetical protein ACJIZ3_014651 [Penstemon smallii]|uniref:LOB domain-containing protein n=1 Tax=Penstemon smallii TaxID=265156 RepID=A0ABD3RKG4_9LAMI